MSDKMRQWLDETDFETRDLPNDCEYRWLLRLVKALMASHGALKEIWVEDCGCDACLESTAHVRSADAVIAEIEAELAK